MSAAPRFRAPEVERREWPFRLRPPFRFGIVTVTMAARRCCVRASGRVGPGGLGLAR